MKKASKTKMRYIMNAINYPTVNIIAGINNKETYYYSLHTQPYNVYIPHMIARNRIHTILHALLTAGVINPDDIISTLDEEDIINPVSNRYNYNGVNISIIKIMNDTKTCINIKYNTSDGYNVNIWNAPHDAQVSSTEIHSKRMGEMIASICCMH